MRETHVSIYVTDHILMFIGVLIVEPCARRSLLIQSFNGTWRGVYSRQARVV